MHGRVLLFVSLAVACPAAARPARSDAPNAFRISSTFGTRTDPFLGSAATHRGVDLAGAPGTPILAAAPGTVRFAGVHGGYGNFVEIDHGDGTRTRYGHLSRIDVTAGETVARGATLGLMGSTGRSTGNHLHFEYWVGGVAVDPLRYLARAPVSPSWAPLQPLVMQPALPFRSAFARARAVQPADPVRPATAIVSVTP